MVERGGDVPPHAAGDELHVAEPGLHLLECRLPAVERTGRKVRTAVVQRLRDDGELKTLRRMRILLIAEILPPPATKHGPVAHLVGKAEAWTDIVPVVRPVRAIE